MKGNDVDISVEQNTKSSMKLSAYCEIPTEFCERFWYQMQFLVIS